MTASILTSLIELADFAQAMRRGDHTWLSHDLCFAVEYGMMDCDSFLRSNLVSDISDTYKDLNGIRPRWMDFDSMTTQELEELLLSLYKQCEEEYKSDEQREAEQAETNAVYMNDGKPATFKPFECLGALLVA